MMKTAEEKVDHLMSNWITAAQTLAQLERLMVQLLKEQDRDTRTACAEATSQLAQEKWFNGLAAKMLHAACTNVKTV